MIQSTTTPVAPTIRPCVDHPAKETCRVFLEAVNIATSACARPARMSSHAPLIPPLVPQCHRTKTVSRATAAAAGLMLCLRARTNRNTRRADAAGSTTLSPSHRRCFRSGGRIYLPLRRCRTLLAAGATCKVVRRHAKRSRPWLSLRVRTPFDHVATLSNELQSRSLVVVIGSFESAPPIQVLTSGAAA